MHLVLWHEKREIFGQIGKHLQKDDFQSIYKNCIRVIRP